MMYLCSTLLRRSVQGCKEVSLLIIPSIYHKKVYNAIEASIGVSCYTLGTISVFTKLPESPQEKLLLFQIC